MARVYHISNIFTQGFADHILILRYIKNKAFDDNYYKDLIMEYLKQYKQATFADIFKLLDGKLSDVLDKEQKRRKVKYLLRQLKVSNKICVQGSMRNAVWTIGQ